MCSSDLRRLGEGSTLVLVVLNRRTRMKLYVFLCIACLVAGLEVYSFATGESPVSGNLKPVSSAPVPGKVIAFSFDLTFGEKAADEIMNVLKGAGVKSTFFVAGPWAAAHPDVVKRIVREQHELGTQGYYHENLSTCDRSRISLSLSMTHELLKGIAGVEPSLFRPPNGDWNESVIEEAMEVGYSTITWSLDSLDWRTTNEADIMRRVVREAKPGAIVRFHASDLSGQTQRALPGILRDLSANGFRVVSVGELLKLSGK